MSLCLFATAMNTQNSVAALGTAGHRAQPVAASSHAVLPELKEAELRDLGLKRGADGLITRIPSDSPNPVQQQQIRDTRYGMFIHFGINTFVNQEWTDGTVPVEKYAPTELAAEEWVQAARNAGMSHVVLVTKHHDGFCLWPTRSDALKYSVAFTSNRTDVVKAVADACRKYGVRFAVYYSLWDRRWDRVHAEDYKKDRAAANRAYVDYMLEHLKELLGNYGPVSELWLDGNWEKIAAEWDFPRIYDLVKRLQPRCQMAVNNTIGPPGSDRSKGLGVDWLPPVKQKAGDLIRYFPCDFRLLDPELPGFPDPKVFTSGGQSYWMPFEATVCLNDKWFWHTDDHGLKPLDQLEALYYRATAQNNLLLLNSPPNRDGHMRADNIQRLAELRERLGLAIGEPFPKNVSVHATAQASSMWEAAGYEAQQAVGENPDTRWSAARGDLTPTLTQTFAAPTRINRVLLREYGEGGRYRVTRFEIEAQVEGHWRVVATGERIGASRMFDFAPVRASALRLKILSATEAPSLYSFWAFDTQADNQ
jgi:alpha-L-fucosidase